MDSAVFLHAFTSYFVIIDPIGVSLIFNALTRDSDACHARKMAIKTTIIAITITLVFGFYGEAFLKKLGISIEALRVSGGILLFVTAYKLITRTKEKVELTEESKTLDISVFPMSIPLISGPGTLTLTVLLFSAPQAAEAQYSVALAAIATFLVCFICFLSSRYIKKVIGQTGDDILCRLLGVILAALAIQFIADGIQHLFLD